MYSFAGHCLDPERRELRRGDEIVPMEPQVFDLLQFLVRHRDRVVTKEQLFAAIWSRRVVSESTLSSRIAAVRRAIRDTGDGQRLIRTYSRKGFRFVGEVHEHARPDAPQPALRSDGVEASAAAAETARRSERRQLSIVNCRIAGPASSIEPDPEDLRADLAAHWRSVRSIIEDHGGFVAHCTAESLLAYFGYPRLHEHDAERAVRAALAIVEAARRRESESHGKPMQVAVGVATGVVVLEEAAAGDAAVPQATGETPFAAARMVAVCAPGSVVISGTTRVHLGNLFEYRALGAGGRGEGQGGAFVVLGGAATADRFEALRAGGAPRVGRDEELELLQRRWQQSADGEGRVVLLSGEPGIGKSHLVSAFQDAIRAQPHGCLRYFCSPHGTQSALHPVIGLLEHLAGIGRGDVAAVKLGKLEQLVSAHFDAARDSVALLADLMAIPTSGHYAPLSLSARRRKELLLELLVAQVARLAGRRRVLVVLEDAHWVDPTTGEFLDVLVDRVRRLPAMLIVTHRPEYRPPWLGQSHVTSLLLGRLGPRESAALIRQVAGDREVRPALLQRIVAQADGVPLFLEEVTKAVLESGGMDERGSGKPPVDAAARVPMPVTVRASLAARLERLGEARALVQTCSALGREFSYALVRSVAAPPDDALAPLLRRAVDSGLLHQRGTMPDAAFAFNHALVQEAAYETMLRSQRERLHRRIVEVFEHDFADLQARRPEVFAHHCAEAGYWEKAIEARIRAARLARDRSTGIEAQAQVEIAMQLLPRITDGTVRRQLEGRLQVALGDALVMTRGFASPEVVSAMSRARRLLDESTCPAESMDALCGTFNYHLIRSESPACLALAKPYLRKRLDRPTATVISYLVGTSHLHLGNFRKSITHLESALSTYDEDECRPLALIAGYHMRSFMLIWLGLGHLYVGSLERAQRTITDAVNDARGRSHPFTLVSALLALARYRQHTLDLAGAIEATEEGAAIAREQRSPYHESRAGILRALNVCDSGRAEEAIALLEQALVAHHATGANFQSSYNLSRLAQAHAQAGRLDRALELAGQAVGEVERTGERWWQAEALRMKGEILLRASPTNGAEAEHCFATALARAREQEARLWELQAAQSMARLWSTTGRRPQAAELLARVYGTFSEGLDMPILVAARQSLQSLVA